MRIFISAIWPHLIRSRSSSSLWNFNVQKMTEKINRVTKMDVSQIDSSLHVIFQVRFELIFLFSGLVTNNQVPRNWLSFSMGYQVIFLSILCVLATTTRFDLLNLKLKQINWENHWILNSIQWIQASTKRHTLNKRKTNNFSSSPRYLKDNDNNKCEEQQESEKKLSICSRSFVCFAFYYGVRCFFRTTSLFGCTNIK